MRPSGGRSVSFWKNSDGQVFISYNTQFFTKNFGHPKIIQKLSTNYPKNHPKIIQTYFRPKIQKKYLRSAMSASEIY